MEAPGPDEDLCREATEQGVLLAARLNGHADLLAESRRLAKWGAVGFVFVEGIEEIPLVVVNSSPNLLFAHLRSGIDIPSPGAIDAVEIHAIETYPPKASPGIAIRSLPTATDVAMARNECDRLQRDLAPFGDWAGYVV